MKMKSTALQNTNYCTFDSYCHAVQESLKNVATHTCAKIEKNESNCLVTQTKVLDL